MSDRLKVSELIERLRKMPQDAEVMTEGCDCIGDAVDIEENDTYVLITRSKVNEPMSEF